LYYSMWCCNYSRGLVTPNNYM